MNNQSSWDSLIQKSESYAKLSKPEVLAVIEVLKNNPELTLLEIHNIFNQTYHNDITQRQMRYILDMMQNNEIINRNDDLTYYLNEEEIHYKSPISLYESLFLAFSFVPFLITGNIILLGIFIGIMLAIVLHHVEYTLSLRKKSAIDKITISLLK